MRPKSAAALLGGIGVALVLGAVARSTAASAPSFAAAENYRLGRGPTSVAVADLNGDGKPDLAVANRDSASVSVVFNRGGGGFTSRQDYGAGEDPASVAITDLNGDGAPDLVTGSSNLISVLLNVGDGTFQRRTTYSAGGTWVATEDLNRDGKPDLVTAGGDGASVSVLLNRGDGTFLPTQGYSVAPEVTSLRVADVNRDGWPDVATTSDLDVVSVLQNHGDGTFEVHRDYQTGVEPGLLTVADLNGDGWPDLVSGRRALDLPSWISVLLNNGDGTFGHKRSYAVGRDSNTAIGAADLNADGSPDLVVVNGNNTLSVLLNRGDGSFSRKRDYGSFLAYGPLAITDMNGDGSPDLVLESWDLGTLSVYLNRGDGSFRAALDYFPGDVPDSLAIADLNGDGAPDLVAGRDLDDRVAVLISKPGLCNVQYVEGLTPAAAKQKLARVNCRVGKIRRAHSKQVKKGRVISQKPEFGAVRPGGAKVNLTVSAGRRR
jgi:hypothetical protein